MNCKNQCVSQANSTSTSTSIPRSRKRVFRLILKESFGKKYSESSNSRTFHEKSRKGKPSAHVISFLYFLPWNPQKCVAHVGNLHMFGASNGPWRFSLFPIWMHEDHPLLLALVGHLMLALKPAWNYAFGTYIVGNWYRNIWCKLDS